MTKMKRFGEYAVERGYCTTDDVARAVKLQRDLEDRGLGRILIGLVMVRYGIIDAQQLVEILKVLERENVEAILAD